VIRNDDDNRYKTTAVTRRQETRVDETRIAVASWKSTKRRELQDDESYRTTRAAGAKDERYERTKKKSRREVQNEERRRLIQYDDPYETLPEGEVRAKV